MFTLKLRHSVFDIFLILTFILLPVLDQVSGALSVSGPSLSLYLRLSIMIIAFLFMIKKGISKFIYVYFLIGVLSISALIDYMNTGSTRNLVKNVIIVSKTIYPIIMYYAFKYISENHSEIFRKVIDYMLTGIVIYSLFIITTNVLSVGVTAYSIGGSTGFMAAGNDLSLLIAVSFPLFFLEFEKRSKIHNLFILIIILGGLSLLLTKSSLMAFGFFILLIIKEIYKRIDKGYKILLTLIIIICFVVFIYLINVLLRNLKIFEIYFNLYSSQGLVWVLFRGRQAIFNNFWDLVEFAQPIGIVFGMGQELFAKTYAQYSFDFWGANYKIAEMDIFDIFFIFGIFGFFFIFWFYIKNGYKAIKENKYSLIIIASIFTFFIHSVFAGHAMSSPIVGTYIAAVFAIREGKNIL